MTPAHSGSLPFADTEEAASSTLAAPTTPHLTSTTATVSAFLTGSRESQS